MQFLRLTKDDTRSNVSRQKREEMGTFVATLIHMLMTKESFYDGSLHFSLCLSIDIQYGEIFLARRNYKAKQKNVESACRAISSMWSSVQDS